MHPSPQYFEKRSGIIGCVAKFEPTKKGSEIEVFRRQNGNVFLKKVIWKFGDKVGERQTLDYMKRQ